MRMDRVCLTFERATVCNVQIVTAWNGFAIGALAAASRGLKSENPPVGRLFPVEGRDPADYRQAAVKVSTKQQATAKKAVKTFLSTLYQG